MKMKILAAAVLMCALCGLSACQTQDEIDQRFPVDAVNVSKKTNLDGVYCYMPDSYLETGKETADSHSYDLIGKDFLIKIRVLPVSSDVKDHTKLSSNLTNLFGLPITITKSIDDTTWECYAELTASDFLNESSQSDDPTPQKINGFIGVNYGYAALAVGQDEKALKAVVQSLKQDETYIANAKTIETAALDSNLSATVNGVAVGEPLSIDAIQSDFAAMGLHFEQMKKELNNVNGSSIQALQNNVYMQINAVQAQGQGVAQAYIGSVAAYNDAVHDYNVQLSNGINMKSKKAEIEKAFGVTLAPEWDKLVVENKNNVSAIESIIIEYDNDNDKVKSIIINKSQAMEDKLNSLNAQSDHQSQASGTAQSSSDIISDSSETAPDNLNSETDSSEEKALPLIDDSETESTETLPESAIDYDVGIGGVK